MEILYIIPILTTIIALIGIFIPSKKVSLLSITVVVLVIFLGIFNIMENKFEYDSHESSKDSLSKQYDTLFKQNILSSKQNNSLSERNISLSERNISLSEQSISLSKENISLSKKHNGILTSMLNKRRKTIDSLNRNVDSANKEQIVEMANLYFQAGLNEIKYYQSLQLEQITSNEINKLQNDYETLEQKWESIQKENKSHQKKISDLLKTKGEKAFEGSIIKKNGPIEQEKKSKNEVLMIYGERPLKELSPPVEVSAPVEVSTPEDSDPPKAPVGITFNYEQIEIRHDYLCEVIAAWGTRHRVLTETIEELESLLEVETELQKKSAISEKINVHRENRKLCVESINDVVKQSKKLFDSGKSTEEEYNQILEWAEPFLNQTSTSSTNFPTS